MFSPGPRPGKGATAGGLCQDVRVCDRFPVQGEWASQCMGLETACWNYWCSGKLWEKASRTVSRLWSPATTSVDSPGFHGGVCAVPGPHPCMQRSLRPHPTPLNRNTYHDKALRDSVGAWSGRGEDQAILSMATCRPHLCRRTWRPS